VLAIEMPIALFGSVEIHPFFYPALVGRSSPNPDTRDCLQEMRFT
jgi:hypothetical protein